MIQYIYRIYVHIYVDVTICTDTCIPIPYFFFPRARITSTRATTRGTSRTRPSGSIRTGGRKSRGETTAIFQVGALNISYPDI